MRYEEAHIIQYAVSSGNLNYFPYTKVQNINVMDVPKEQELKKVQNATRLWLKDGQLPHFIHSTNKFMFKDRTSQEW
jgi:hypothetical protein